MAKQDDENHHQAAVYITKTVPVYPKFVHYPPQNKILSLSNLDRQCPLLMYLVFFYKPPSSSSSSSSTFAHHRQNLSLNSVFNSLKSGLEETLSVWYPAAGRLTLNQNDGKLNLWCNNGGAILVEATTRVKISELGDLSQYNEFFEKLVYKPIFNGNFSEMPLVVAQVTGFGCGGYSIGVGASHSLFDGPATYDFMCAWASNSAILKPKGRGHETLQNIKPVHERGSLLLCCTQNGGVTRQRTSSTMAAAAINHLYLLIKQAMTDHHHQKINNGADDNGNSSSSLSSFVLKTFHLSGANIEILKRRTIGSGHGSTSSCSAFEVIAAHLWKARTKALCVRKDSVVCLQFAVDTRHKMDPPLPKAFTGNAYVLASVALTAGELEETSYGVIIDKIKEAKNSVDNDYVNAYIEALDGPQQAQANLPPLKELTMVSDWTRTPFHKIEFLAEGEAAAYASPLISPIPQVAYFMQSPSDFRGIDVRIGMPPQILNAFTCYFLNNPQ